MTASQPAATRVPGYGLAAPRESDAVAALERVFGAQRGRALWTEACALAGLRTGETVTTALLERAIESLASQGGAAATVARSISIRLRTFHQLSARLAGSNAGVRS